MPRPADLLPAELLRHRAALEQRLASLRGELAADRAKVQGSARDPGEVFDREEDAERLARDSVADAELARDLGEAVDVQAALDRITAGHYGRCVDCEEAISRERLDVQPAAARCAACQAAFEGAA